MNSKGDKLLGFEQPTTKIKSSLNCERIDKFQLEN